MGDHSPDGGSGPEPDPQAAAGRLDTLVFPETRSRAWNLPRDGNQDLEAGRQAPSARALHGLQRLGFESKAADIIGLYINPPKHAAIFCLDEKSHIQALDRLDPVLPMSPGRIERHGFEYFRHGTLSLDAALASLSGQVYGKPVARHTSAEFVAPTARPDHSATPLGALFLPAITAIIRASSRLEGLQPARTLGGCW